MTVWFASGNKHKQQELAAILAGTDVKLPAEAGITDFNPAETGGTFAENALIKAAALYAALSVQGGGASGKGAAGGLPVTKLADGGTAAVLADDSGLCVDALGGRPGVFSARYYGKDSWNSDKSFKDEAGVKLTDSERNLLLLEELGQTPERSCRFVCAMVLYFGPNRFYLVQETLEGEIVGSASDIRGARGFGYDPIVYIKDLGRTVAELSEEEKNSLSHRGKAGKTIAKLLFH
jgi:XTP/dITP diphosphohydrolase